MLVIVIGYDEDGKPLDGTVFSADNDRDASRKALAWVAHESDCSGWRAFEYLPEWGPGREIKPVNSDYAVNA